MEINYIIYAQGMKGEVVGNVFIPYREVDGTFPIFSELLKLQNSSNKIQKAENKVKGVTDIAEAVSFIRRGGFRWRLKDYVSGQINIFKPEHIVIEEL